MRRLLLPLIAIASAACAPPAAPARAPEVPPSATVPPPKAPAGDPFVVTGPLREEWFPFLKPPVIDPSKTRLGSPPKGLAPAPAECAPYHTRKPSGAQVACADPASGLAALDAALSVDDGNRRDAMLADLEACPGLPAGVARSLRGELGPIECAEGIVDPPLKAPPAGISGLVYHALLGQAVASRLSRTALHAPTLAPPFDKPRVLEFVHGPMAEWFREQSLAIEEVSRAAAELPYYGKGIAAIEAGVADLRLVEAVRAAPIPDEFTRDPELRSAYYGSLDEWLDPRKDRGRDATLVGLRELSLVGVIHDSRVDRARTLLSRMYGGRRIDALDALLLPSLPETKGATVEERLAGTLPTLYAGLLLDESAASRPATLRRLMARGVPLPQRAAMRKLKLTEEAHAIYARAHLDLGRVYWSGVDFDQAVAHAAAARGPASPVAADATFTLALALALRTGPESAVDMMRKAPHPLTPGQTDALDFLARQTPASASAGLAAFDAALIHQLTTPETTGEAYWRDLAQRFHAAAALLTDPRQRALALERAQAAEATARAVIAIPAAPTGKPTPAK